MQSPLASRDDATLHTVVEATTAEASSPTSGYMSEPSCGASRSQPTSPGPGRFSSSLSASAKRDGRSSLGRPRPRTPTKARSLPREREASRSQVTISRVLYRGAVSLSSSAIIPLGPASPRASSSLPGGSSGPLSLARRASRIASLCGLAPSGVCHATPVTGRAVGSYSTFSPLPAAVRRGPAVRFLWHSPRGHPHQALPGTSPCGARTFLPRREPRPAAPAITRSPETRAA